MPNYNKVVLVGHLTRDPDVRFVGASGISICSAGIAVSEKFKNKTTGETKENVAFIDLKIWGGSGERFAEWFRKGSAVLIEGKLETETWDDKQTGQKRSKLVVNVGDYQNLTPRQMATAGGGSDEAPEDDNIPF